MNWKENSRGRLDDITEENGIEKTARMDERTPPRQDDDDEEEEEETESDHENQVFEVMDSGIEGFEHSENSGSPEDLEEDGIEYPEATSFNEEEYQDNEESKNIEFPFAEVPKPTERRRTIYELDSYAASNISILEGYEAGETSATDLDESREFRYSETSGMPGMARINLSPLTQKIIGCVIGENVTTEYPWIYVRKEIIEDNLDLHDESSDFLPVRDHIGVFSDKNILIGYAPTSSEEGQFYICLTEAGRDAVIRNIEALRIEQEDRVRNAVYKTAGKWEELGSGQEVDDTIVKNTRPLFEIEVESTSDLLNAPIKLTDRNADDQRDGYVELLPYRQTFDNVTKRLVSKGIQTGLTRRDNDAQTAPSMLVNSWFQYRYEPKTINTNAYNEDEKKAMKRFLDKYTDHICDKVSQNATWDIYTDDCANLVRNVRDTQAPIPIAYTEHQSYYDGKLTSDKVINDLCWHPFWTGIAAAVYNKHCKSDILIGPPSLDEVLTACESDNQVLIWSFTDCLTPKLILECHREVTVVSICPLDGNLIVGGCASGQIAIWSILGKIEEVEAIVVNTTAQVKYRIAMRSLMSWMKEPTNSSIIRPAAMSSLQHSQKGPITQILWLPPYNKIDKNGRIESLPADTTVDELSWQFATSSQDGTIAFWDMRWKPPEDKKTDVRGKKKKKTVRRPEALLQSISKYKSLDGVFRPFYMLEVNYPDEERPVVITTMSIYRPKIEKEQIEPNPMREKDDVSVRKYYKLAITKPDYELEPTILVGTVDGDLGRLSWEGYDFTTGELVNREIAKWDWINDIHDGPVTHSVRSKYLKDVVLTIGGTVFAVWRDNFGEPIIWRRCKVRYTACCWGTFRPTVAILARVDGTAEIWDFIVKTHEPSFTQGLSGRIITGIYTHELYLNPQCVAFCDYNGTLRVFTAPADLLNFDIGDIRWMKKFIDREVDRLRQFKRWQKSWNETNVDNIEKRKRETELETEKKKREAEQKIQAEMDEMMNKLRLEEAAKSTSKPGEFLEKARAHWKAMELERMQRVILEKKGLREDILEKRRAPYLKLRQNAKKKKRKIREIMQLQDQIFEETMAFLFPERYYHGRKATDKPGLPEIDAIDDKTASLKELLDEQPKTKFRNSEEKIIYDFMEIQSAALAEMKTNPYEPNFDWRKVLSEGKLRRRSMDVELKESTGRKDRKFTEEMQQEAYKSQSTERYSNSGDGISKATSDVTETVP